MADGRWRRIEDVLIGEFVQGRRRKNRVIAYDRLLLGEQKDPNLYCVNGAFETTSDHLILSRETDAAPETWAVLRKEHYGCGHESTVIYDADLNPIRGVIFKGIKPERVGQVTVGQDIGYGTSGWRTVKTIAKVKEPDPTQIIYSLVCAGDGTMQISGMNDSGYVVSAWVDDDKWYGRPVGMAKRFKRWLGKMVSGISYGP